MSTYNTTIFISYRRKESRGYARSMFERLKHDFPGQVFMDVNGMRLGENFRTKIGTQLQGCRVLLALIGPEWQRATDKHGRVRLQDKRDWVRLEIATALQREIRVIPVLVDGASMPDEEALPEDLHPLLDLHALSLDLDRHFEHGMADLVAVMREVLELAAEPLAPPEVPRHLPESGNSLHTLSVSALPTVHLGNHRAEDAESPIARPPWVKDCGRDKFPTPWADFEIAGVVQRMRWVEPGSFIMGTSQEEIDKLINSPACRLGYKDTRPIYRKWLSFEVPSHEVVLSRGFWLADTACTVKLWATLMGSDGRVAGDLDDFPVCKKTFVQVKEFLQKLGVALGDRLNGASVVLPTEAQWEYSCRAGTNTPFNFGADFDREFFYSRVNCDPGRSLDGRHQLEPRGKLVNVKDRPPNGWGFYQMHGNVFEWCSDVYRPYSSESIEDPNDMDFGLPCKSNTKLRIVKGGAYGEAAVMCRSAVRLKKEPNSDKVNFVGFRIAILPSGASAPTA